MKTYFNELAPWERKKEYHEAIKLGGSINAQTSALKIASDNQIAALLRSTNSIISSQERSSELIQSGLSELSYGLNDISKGIQNLGAVFEWGISEVIWHIEQNTDVLRNILETLESPKGTEANERKNWGDKAYGNGFLDDALEDYLAAEKIFKYDFTIYISIGMIYLKHKLDKSKALEYFDKAIKYAKPESKSHTSYSLLCKSVTLFDLGKVKEAEESSQEAINISPDFIEAYYQNAQYNSQLGNVEKSISNLDYTFKNDIRYYLKCDKDLLFEPIRLEVNNLILRNKNDIYNSSKIEQSNLLLKIKELNNLISELNNDFKFEYKEINFEKEIKLFNHLIAQDSLFDAVETRKCLIDLETKIIEEYKILSNFISEATDSANIEKNDEINKIERNIDSSKARKKSYGSFIFAFCSIIGMIFGCKSCLSHDLHFNPPGQLWAFIKAVVIGALIGGFIYLMFKLAGEERTPSKEIKESKLIQALDTKINRLRMLQLKLQERKRFSTG